MNNFEKISIFFKKEIKSRGCDYLIYNDNDTFYIPGLVEIFYSSFTFEDMSISKDLIFLTFDNKSHVVDPNVILELTGIPLASGMNQHPLISFEDYKLIMGVSCSGLPIGGIDGNSLYRNVFATGRWLVINVVSNFHETSFYT